MPLSSAADRDPIHTRTVTCQGFRRRDGLWDVDARLVDAKSYACPIGDRGELQAGEPVHEMWIRVTLDDTLQVRAVEAVTEHSPFAACGGITPNYQRLVGLRIGPGWTRAVKERLAGVHGCTHLVELLGPVATTAFQTIYPILTREREEKGEVEGADGRRPPLLNTCHMFASDGDLVRQNWPEHYTGPA